VLRLATRGSQLALWQARRVASLLEAAQPGLEVALVPVSTAGDRHWDVPVWQIGGRGVFVGEVQMSVLDGHADVAVHSAKDLPPVSAPGLVLAALPERGDPRDALVGSRLSELAPGATVATGSQRRRAQLAHLRPDLSFVSLRGNITTRLGKVPAGGAIVVAMTALERLQLAPPTVEPLAVELMVPQVAQAALAVECREGDSATIELLAAIDDAAVRAPVEAERAFLAAIGGGCDLPVGGHARLSADGHLMLEGLLASVDGKTVVRRQANRAVTEPDALGRAVAALVLDSGGRQLLASMRGRT